MRLASLRPWQRQVVTCALGAVGLVVFAEVLLPGVGRNAARGAPMAVLFSGLVLGSVNALTAAGLVLVYRSTRVVNFAQTAIGAAGAELCFQFVRYTRVPFPVAFLLGLVLAAAAGFVFEMVVGRRFRDAPRLVPTVATIAAAGLLAGTSAQVDRLPFFPKVAYRSAIEVVGASDLRRRLPFARSTFTVGGLHIPFGFPEVFAIVVAASALCALAWFLRSTRVGVATRALAENRDRAALLGISVTLLSALVWTLAGALSGIGVTLSGLLATPAAAVGFAPGLLLTALAAGILGRMRSLPVTAVAAVGITVATRAAGYALPKDGALIDLGLFALVAGGLLLQRRQATRSESGGTETWQMTDEQRPVPNELAGLPTLRTARRVLVASALAGVVVLPLVTSTRIINLAGVIALTTLVALSMVVLTGWAGQVSLGQFAFAAVGAVIAGSLTSRVGLTFWLAVPIATALTAGLAVLVGLPALRIAGLFLAAVTFAFAFAVHSVLFQPRYFGWLLPTEVHRPTLFLLDFADERSMYFLCVVALAACVLIVVRLRRSRFGRLLIAVRENEANVASAGVSVVRLKLMAFGVSGGLAGLAGAMLAHQQRGLSAASFTADASLSIFILAVLGGVSSVNGALIGSAYGNIVTYFLAGNPVVSTLLGFGGPLLVLYAVPGGLISLVVRLRDGILRIVAQRRQLVVPSLFPGVDPEALAARLIPMAEPLDDAGISALSAARRRYTLPSLFLGVSGDADVSGAERPRRDVLALAAAASRARSDLEPDGANGPDGVGPETRE